MRYCTIDDCAKREAAKGMCAMHYARAAKHGDPRVVTKRPPGAGTINAGGYREFGVRRNGRKVKRREHVEIAERALGKSLPAGVVVHHVDGNRLNNEPGNLLVCSSAYHSLIHKRMRAVAACGHADWIKCHHCKAYSPPDTLRVYQKTAIHPGCVDAANSRRNRRTTR